jgi:hypothetical protein
LKVKIDGKKIDIDIFFEKKSTKGRPRLVLTEDALKLVESLSRIMCTEEEIASILNCSRDLFYTPDNKDLYRQAVEKGKCQGKQSLRRMQYELAKKNATMAIWLGKQYLGQSDVGLITGDGDTILRTMTTVAQLINNPAQNRDIEDLE